MTRDLVEVNLWLLGALRSIVVLSHRFSGDVRGSPAPIVRVVHHFAP